MRRFFLFVPAEHLTFTIHRDILIIVIQEMFSFFIAFFHWRNMRRFFFRQFREEHLTFQNRRDILISQSDKWPFSICFFDQFNYSNKFIRRQTLTNISRLDTLRLGKILIQNLHRRKCSNEPVKFEHH